MSTEGKIKIMQAYSDGQKIQIDRGNMFVWSDWDRIREPNWDWENNDYRIKPELKTKRIPWTAETAPFPLALRLKEWGDGEYMLFGIVDGYVWSHSLNEDTGVLESHDMTLDELADPNSEWEQRDGSPCCIIEEVEE